MKQKPHKPRAGGACLTQPVRAGACDCWKRRYRKGQTLPSGRVVTGTAMVERGVQRVTLWDGFRITMTCNVFIKEHRRNCPNAKLCEPGGPEASNSSKP